MLTQLQLDGNGPLHAQLTRALKQALESGQLGQGSRLPPTRFMSEQMGLSRNTVLAAYEQLRTEGYIDGRVGSGSYVTAPTRRPAEPAPATRLPAPNTFVARTRQHLDHQNLPGKAIPGVRFSLQYGSPYTNPALTTAWARELSHAALYTSPNYSWAQGLPELRQAISEYVLRRGVEASPDDVLIVAGTQQAMSLCARVLMEAGDPVAIEEPQYYATRSIMLAYGAHLQPVPVDEEGLQVDALPDVSSLGQAPRLICTTPSHQFPYGGTMPEARRAALLEYAHRHGSWVIEDDYDGEIRYDARPLSSLKSQDRHDRVIYVGTFSKMLFPSMRLGFMVVPRGLRKDFVAAKWMEDFGASAIDQAALANFMKSGAFDRHLRRSLVALRERRDALLEGLRQMSNGRLEFRDSQAGMHIPVWLKHRSREEGRQFIERARGMGLGLYSLSPYYLDPPDRAGLILGYAGLPVRDIELALEVLRRCLEVEYSARAH
ncbi:PLP-dependent aminotransferase family protein [Pseudoxanthomonas indica]|uniref:Transcriptional regulator, GntR family n=1 Tax=Pseudoxanthomonas indica TaxID=428993 RepID=A0A1T5KBM1_9GAMM|nr:PLP-dependent aminotransferase family protein [Pseudoxanthomonas indica]GGD48255.1 GntR family transcriptional regulator [Pseudoxanthomonas indica]SKC61077.1 transcriptional regulator, GntR family [Pseudoxanthomonas indica]